MAAFAGVRAKGRGPMLMRPEPQAIDKLVRMALLEDAPWGDLTSQMLLPADSHISAQLVAREEGVLCGEDFFSAAMSITGQVSTAFIKKDADRFAKGDVLAKVHGPAQAILQAERVALNFVQRLSGIATLTAQFVARTAGTKTRIVDTRKTTPGLRLVERYAVRCGGGFNHRFSLSDAVMVKDNHLAVLARSGPKDLALELRSSIKRLPHTVHVEVEVDRRDQIEEVLSAGAHTLMLDNFTMDELRAGVEQIAGRALVEASGGITLDRIAEIASTGVDIISVGALTHSFRSIDLALDMSAD